MTNHNIVLLETVAEAQEILSNAREAVQAGEITQEQYADLLDSCYRAYCQALVEQRPDPKEQS